MHTSVRVQLRLWILVLLTSGAAWAGVPNYIAPTSATGTAGTNFNFATLWDSNVTNYTATGLPPGLMLLSTGGILGTPTMSGTFPTTLTVTGAGGNGMATLTITINAAVGSAPVINSKLTQFGSAAAPFTYSVTATNSPTSFSATNLPPGLAIGAVSGVISGTPTTPGTYDMTITATNGFGPDSTALTINISPPNAIDTVVGGGPQPLNGDGGPATGAFLNAILGVAVDAAGNVYISDHIDQRVRKVDTSGNITTVAGNGLRGFAGDNGPAVNAQLSSPRGLAVDTAGNLYIADSGNERIRKVDVAGNISTFAGNGGRGIAGDGGAAISATLGDPFGVAVDTSGNIYIAEDFNNRVRKVSGGIINTIAGNGTLGYSGDGASATLAAISATDVAVDNSGNVYIGGSSVVRKVSGGIIGTVAGNSTPGFSGDGGPATAALLGGDIRVAVDASGNVFIADGKNNDIRKVSGGIITTFAGTGTPAFAGDGGQAAAASLNNPLSVAAGAQGVFVADTFNGRVRKVANTGVISTIAGSVMAPAVGDGGSATKASLRYPNGVAVDGSGRIFVSDSINSRIRVASGTINTLAGTGLAGDTGDGGPAAAATVLQSTGLTLDGSGNVFTASHGRSRVRRISGGTIFAFAGTGGDGFGGDGAAAVSAKLDHPDGVCADVSGNIYIADKNNHRIRKVDTLGKITTVAGNGTPLFAGDGGPPLSASLAFPTGVFVDGSGNIFIADSGNNRIRKVSGGVITTIAGNGTPGFSGDGTSAFSASLNFPTDVAVDQAGFVYIADSNNNRVRAIDINGNINTIAGNGTPAFAGDGGNPISASIFTPTKLAVQAPYIYIADSNNNRIRQIGPIFSPVSPPPMTVSGTVGAPFSSPNTFVFGGFPKPGITLSLLPAGLTSNPNGDINGTPTAAGTTIVTYTATNSAGSATATLTININPAPIPPTITSALTASGMVGVPFTYTLTATGTVPITLSASPLPAGLTTNGNLIVSGTPTAAGTTNVTLTATNVAATVSKTLVITITAPNPPPLISGLTAAPNPAKAGDSVAFNAVATDPSGLPLSYTWDFGDGSALAMGASVAHVYNPPIDSSFTATVSVSNGGPAVTATISLQVFAPSSSGTTIKNVSDGKPGIVSPFSGIKIEIASSAGGVIELNIDLGAIILRDSINVSTDFTDLPGRGTAGVNGVHPVHKFTQSGVFVATSNAVEVATGRKGKARKTISISRRETGQDQLATDEPASKDIVARGMSGKFFFSRSGAASSKVSSDTVSFSGTIKLAPGIDLSKVQEISIGMGNITDRTVIDPKGKGTLPGAEGNLKKLKVKYPHLKGTTITKGGEEARIDVTIAAPKLSDNGFDTEGVTPDAPDVTPKVFVRRSIQIATVLAGVSYETLAPVNFKLSAKKDTGQMSFRRGQ